MSEKNVVVIGAGPGGLAAAMQLAKAGAKVTVLEKMDRVGGRSAAITQQGYRFDTGPTFFLYPRVLQEIYRSVGYELFDEVPMHRLDPQYRLMFGAGGELDCTSDLPRMEQQVQKFSPDDSGSLTRYMNHNRVKLEKFRPILESPFDSPLDLLRPSLLGAARHVTPWRTLGQELSKYFKDPRLVLAFSFQSKYLGMSPFNCPSLFSILSFLEYEYGVYHPFGGCNQVNTSMAQIAAKLGADIRLSEAVTELEFDGKKLIAVKTEAERYRVDATVINADFSNTMQKLVPDRLRRRWSDKKLASKKFSCSTFMMYLGVEGKYPNVAHHTIHISADYEKNLRQIENDFAFPDDPSIYLHNPSIIDDSMAPPGHSAIYILVPVPHLTASTAWTDEETHKFRELTLTKLEMLGLENLRERIRFEKIITPRDWSEKYEIYRGATFNLAHNLGQMLHLRPHNQFEELRNVFLVGGGTHPGSGLPVIYESSRITTKKVMSNLGIKYARNEPANIGS